MDAKTWLKWGMVRSWISLGLLAAFASAAMGQMTVDVDARDCAQRVWHATVKMPAKTGPMVIYYPKWIPGEHGPTGPIQSVTGLHFYAAGQEVEWRRDLEDGFKFRVTVPPGATEITAKFDYSMSTDAASSNAKLGVINWYYVAMAPADVSPDSLTVQATLIHPEGWKSAGSLDVAKSDPNKTVYKPTTLTSLFEHPVLIGQHLRTLDLFPSTAPEGEHAVDIVADSEWALKVPDHRIEAYKKLVKETRAVFGGVGHYEKYHWLLTLSDSLGSFGLEHHECSDDRIPENSAVDDDESRRSCILLPHEFFHSWNGKSLRPAGLVTGGYEKPMKDDLLWVYEGLTNYYGEVLSARSGLCSIEDLREIWAADFHEVSGPGRTWRPLRDTDEMLPSLTGNFTGHGKYRRGLDYYAEGSLIWLEADVTIRRLTKGEKSLDDFCRLFHGVGGNGSVFVRSYDFTDVVSTLNLVAKYDWASFFDRRLREKLATPPTGGFEGAGFRFTYNDKPNFFAAGWKPSSDVDATSGLGLAVSESGDITDCLIGSPAFAAGLGSGMKVMAVNGRKFNPEGLKKAIAESTTSKDPIVFIIENGSFVKSVSVDYHDGIRQPHLIRVEGVADLISQIAKSRT